MLSFPWGPSLRPQGAIPSLKQWALQATQKLKLKFLVTTIVSAVIVGAIYAAFTYELIRLDDLPGFSLSK